MIRFIVVAQQFPQAFTFFRGRVLEIIQMFPVKAFPRFFLFPLALFFPALLHPRPVFLMGAFVGFPLFGRKFFPCFTHLPTQAFPLLRRKRSPVLPPALFFFRRICPGESGAKPQREQGQRQQ
jgi:hypothetical protein